MAKIDDFEVKVRSKIQKTVRIVTRNVMNDLAKQGQYGQVNLEIVGLPQVWVQVVLELEVLILIN